MFIIQDEKDFQFLRIYQLRSQKLTNKEESNENRNSFCDEKTIQVTNLEIFT